MWLILINKNDYASFNWKHFFQCSGLLIMMGFVKLEAFIPDVAKLRRRFGVVFSWARIDRNAKM